MIYTAATYANAEHTQVTGTDASGNTETVALDHKLFRQPEHGPAGFLKAGGKITPYVAPAEPANYRLYKSTLIRRLTEAEAVTLTALLDASPVKSKMLWNASEWLGSDDPLFANLQQAIGSALGASRAAEILAEHSP